MNESLKKPFSLFPPGLLQEIKRIVKVRSLSLSSISELRIRRGRRCSLVISGERVGLVYQLTDAEMRKLFVGVCEGSVYAHRDTVTDGYVSMDGGIRVGIAGEAGYDGGELVGVSEVYSLVFRIPTLICSVSDELFSFWQRAKRGMLIYSPPSVGKTSALRALAGMISRGKNAKNVVILDERREFLPDDYKGASVDILRGYRRARGIEIALRTMSAEVVVIDELGSLREACDILQFANSGISILATAHARSEEEVLKREGARAWLDSGAFDILAGIFIEDGRRVAKMGVYEPLNT